MYKRSERDDRTVTRGKKHALWTEAHMDEPDEMQTSGRACFVRLRNGTLATRESGDSIDGVVEHVRELDVHDVELVESIEVRYLVPRGDEIAGELSGESAQA